ncbi:hypothetical protein BH24CHL4_BH24CHL4_21440 [soil metagenome]
MLGIRRSIFLSMLLVLVVVGSDSRFSSANAVAQSSDGKTINVEFIVDASGSMAAETDTGAIRMVAAKTVLRQVVTEIPNAEGINVGLRVYGHEGDNTDAGRPASCVSSELLVPMSGINPTRLIARIDSLQPVGWTPIGFALQQALADFDQPAGDNMVNAIVLVTDGLETCDADPVAIADDLRASDAAIITHVIGFGTTAEELAILSGIAEAGDGQLLGSNNAGQLMSALFTILEELEVVEETGTGETRESPLGIGRVGQVGDYEVSVLSVTPNATDMVAAENPFNDPPSPGNQFFIARVNATYVGPSAGNPGFELNFQAVGDLSVGYTVFNNTCGVYPDDLYNVNELFTGGSAEFNVCWQIDSQDQDSLVMYVESLLDFSGQPVWFSLGNPIQTVVDPEGTAEAPPTEPVPAPTAAPPPQADSGSNGSARETTLPLNTVGQVGDYEISVLSTTPNATDMVAAENPFNEPPAAGNQYFIARVNATYIGASAGNPGFELNFQAVGDLNVSYTIFNNTCGVYPEQSYDVTELFSGGSAEFNVCWQIDSEDESSLVMYVESMVDFTGQPVWFALE